MNGRQYEEKKGLISPMLSSSYLNIYIAHINANEIICAQYFFLYSQPIVCDVRFCTRLYCIVFSLRLN